MLHVMFDVDGTLVKTSDFEDECYFGAINEVFEETIDFEDRNWKHVSDAGILKEIIDSHNLSSMRDDIHRRVKSAFIRKVSDYLANTPAKEVEGAGEFIKTLRQRNDTVISIATGGWYETAVLKLQSAGIDTSGIPIATSNDHYIREEIMKIAESKATPNTPMRCYYFGDAAWDKKACEKIGFNFVLVGHRIVHNRGIENYIPLEKALECLSW